MSVAQVAQSNELAPGERQSCAQLIGKPPDDAEISMAGVSLFRKFKAAMIAAFHFGLLIGAPRQ